MPSAFLQLVFFNMLLSLQIPFSLASTLKVVSTVSEEEMESPFETCAFFMGLLRSCFCIYLCISVWLTFKWNFLNLVYFFRLSANFSKKHVWCFLIRHMPAVNSETDHRFKKLFDFNHFSIEACSSFLFLLNSCFIYLCRLAISRWARSQN